MSSPYAENVLEAERLLVGAMLLSPDKASEVAEIVQARHFFDRRAGAIAGAVFELASKPEPWDLLAVRSTLRAQGRLEQAGGPVGLAEFASSTTSSAHAFQHARLVKNAAVLRAMQEAAGEVGKLALETNPGDAARVEDAVSRAEALVYSAGDEGEGAARMQGIDDVLQAVIRDVDHGKGGLQTGYYDLDALLVDLRPGEVLGIAGRPGTGKTAFALNLARRFAGDGRRALFCTLEMSAPELVGRMIATEAEVDTSRIRRRTLDERDRIALGAAAGTLHGLPLMIADDSGPTVGRIAARARRASVALGGLDVLFIDYVQLMRDLDGRTEVERLSNISSALKALAKDLRVVLVPLLQFNREAADSEPQMHHLRGSGAFEQDLDGCILLWEPAIGNAKQAGDTAEIQAKLAKWRHGPTGAATLYFRKRFGRFDNPTLGESEEIL